MTLTGFKVGIETKSVLPGYHELYIIAMPDKLSPTVWVNYKLHACVFELITCNSYWYICVIVCPS